MRRRPQPGYMLRLSTPPDKDTGLGLGVYRAGLSRYFDNGLSARPGSLSCPPRPGPYGDKGLAIDPCASQSWYYGFATAEQLMRWFSHRFLRYAQDTVQLYAYRGRVLVGDHQAVLDTDEPYELLARVWPAKKVYNGVYCMRRPERLPGPGGVELPESKMLPF